MSEGTNFFGKTKLMNPEPVGALDLAVDERMNTLLRSSCCSYRICATDGDAVLRLNP